MIEDLLGKQKELMEKVPHGIRVDIYPKMTAAKSLIESILLYLNSCGHKPWRPAPLDYPTRCSHFNRIEDHVRSLRLHHDEPISDGKMDARELVSAFGILEETIEYLNAPKEDKLEEITDVLFFYLEQVILGGFTWADIEKEYIRKHKVNLERYKRAKEGDYGWNHRDKGGL